MIGGLVQTFLSQHHHLWIDGSRRSLYVYGTTLAGTYLVVCQTGTKFSAVYHGSNLRFFNGVSFNPSSKGLIVTLSNEIASIPRSLLGSDIDGGRRLEHIDWNNPDGAQVLEVSSLSQQSDANTIFWEKFVFKGVTYSAAVIQCVTSSGTRFATGILRFSGSKHNTFVNKRIAYTSAVTHLNSLYRKQKTTMVVGATVAVAGMVGSVFTGGVTLAITGASVITLLGNGVVGGAQVIDACQAVSVAWADLVGWVKGQTGENMVR